MNHSVTLAIEYLGNR